MVITINSRKVKCVKNCSSGKLNECVRLSGSSKEEVGREAKARGVSCCRNEGLSQEAQDVALTPRLQTSIDMGGMDRF